MKSFAVVNNDIIENIIIADTLEDAENISGLECFEITENNYAEKGWQYDSVLKKAIVPDLHFEMNGIWYRYDKETDQVIEIEEV